MAHAQIRCHPETKSKVRPKKKYAQTGPGAYDSCTSLAIAFTSAFFNGGMSIALRTNE